MPSATQPARIVDLYLASYLVARGYAIVRVERSAGARQTFIFPPLPEDVVMAYYSDEPTVSPRRLLGALRDVKALLQQQF